MYPRVQFRSDKAWHMTFDRGIDEQWAVRDQQLLPGAEIQLVNLVYGPHNTQVSCIQAIWITDLSGKTKELLDGGTKNNVNGKIYIQKPLFYFPWESRCFTGVWHIEKKRVGKKNHSEYAYSLTKIGQ